MRGNCQQNVLLKLFTVKEGPAAQDDAEGDVRIRFLAAGIEDDVSLDHQFDEIPFAVGDVVGEVAFGLVEEVHLETVVGPTGEFHGAALLVEREEFDVDAARGFEYGAAQPRQVPVVRQDHVGAQQGRIVLRIGAVFVNIRHNLIKINIRNHYYNIHTKKNAN